MTFAVLDYMRSVEWLPTAMGESKFVWRVWGGKTTKEEAQVYQFSNEGLTFDLVGVFANYHSMVLNLYSSGKLKPIDTWEKVHMLPGEELLDPEARFFSPLFVTYNLRTKTVNSHPLDSNIITKIIRQKLNDFVLFTQPNLTQADRAAICKKYSSHSLKRGAITDSFKQGSSDHELRAIFRFKCTQTVNRFIDTMTVGNAKTPKL